MSVNAQLCLPVFETQALTLSEEPDIVDAIIASHRRDYRAAMRDLLLDADFIRDQLSIAHRLLSHWLWPGMEAEIRENLEWPSRPATIGTA